MRLIQSSVNTTWKVLFANGAGQRRERCVKARTLDQLLDEIAAAKSRLGLAPDARVVSCYEAGRDGFWLDRALRSKGIENLVVDSASIEVKQRSQHAPSRTREPAAVLEAVKVRPGNAGASGHHRDGRPRRPSCPAREA